MPYLSRWKLAGDPSLSRSVQATRTTIVHFNQAKRPKRHIDDNYPFY